MPNAIARGGLSLAVFSAFIYGLCPAPARAVYADGANSVFVVLVAIFARALTMGAYCAYKKLRLFAPGTNWRRTLVSGLCQALSVTGTMSSLLYLESAVTWIILFTHPLLILLIQAWRQKKPLTPMTIGLTVMAFIGLTFVLDVWNTQSDLSLIGVALASLGGITTAMRTYIYGRQVTNTSPFVVGAENYLIALCFLVFLLFWKMPVPPQTEQGFGWLLVTLSSMVIGSFCSFIGISKMGSFHWSLLSKMELISVTLLSTVFFGASLCFAICWYCCCLVGLVGLSGARDSSCKSFICVKSLQDSPKKIGYDPSTFSPD